jgi:hypothetical protein
LLGSDVQLSAWLRAHLASHQPDEALRRRAEAAGVELEALKRDDPAAYMTVCAAPLVRTDARLVGAVLGVTSRLLPEHQLFRVPLVTPQTDTELRVFPPLTPAERRAFDDALGQLVGEAPYRQQRAFYRVVEERGGRRYELAWPLAPSAYRPGTTGFVGPFKDEAAARAWGEAHADRPSGVVFDTVAYGGAWFCDLFHGEL